MNSTNVRNASPVVAAPAAPAKPTFWEGIFGQKKVNNPAVTVGGRRRNRMTSRKERKTTRKNVMCRKTTRKNVMCRKDRKASSKNRKASRKDRR